MEKKEVISLIDLAARFAKAKGLQTAGYKWLRTAPGRGTNKEIKVGNSLAVLKAIHAFNNANSKPIEIYKATGYDGTPKQTMVIAKAEILRLKGYVLRNQGKTRAKDVKQAIFKIVGKAE
jgi:hypothetical protein